MKLLVVLMFVCLSQCFVVKKESHDNFVDIVNFVNHMNTTWKVGTRM